MTHAFNLRIPLVLVGAGALALLAGCATEATGDPTSRRDIRQSIDPATAEAAQNEPIPLPQAAIATGVVTPPTDVEGTGALFRDSVPERVTLPFELMGIGPPPPEHPLPAGLDDAP